MQVIISFRDEKAVSFDWREWVNGELRQDRQDLRRGERLVISLLSLLLFLSLFFIITNFSQEKVPPQI